MKDPAAIRPLEILLVEDNEADVRLTREALRDGKVIHTLSVANSGEQALAFLRDPDRELPDLVLLDLNLPGLSGREVLHEVKEDPALSLIPVVVLTTSDAERDIISSYRLRANGYVTKPVDLNRFIEVVESIETFWLSVVKLPPKG